MVNKSVLSDDTKLDSIVESFELAYCEGNPPKVQDFLPDLHDDDFDEILIELLRVDMDHRWRCGRQLSLSEYIERFPALQDPQILNPLAFEEYRQRMDAGEQIEKSEYESRYSISTEDWRTTASAEEEDTLATQMVSTDFETLPQLIGTFPEIGDVVSGFRILRQIGKGKFGRVYLAEQNSLSARLVVLKITTSRSIEPQRLAQLQHTNIVPIHSEHEVDSLHILCMPYLGETTVAEIIHVNRASNLEAAGGGLIADAIRKNEFGSAESRSDGRIRRLRTMSYVDACLHLALQVAEGLRHAHDRGILHKDLKPANILVAEDGRPLLLDFNLSEQIVPGGVAGLLVGGTIPYMSPEQLRSLDKPERLDRRTDVFSFGAVIYELMAGTMPFRDGTGDSSVKELLEERQKPVRPVRDRNHAIPQSISDLVSKCLAPSRLERYDDFDQIVTELTRHFESRPLEYTPNHSTKERLAKWRRRHPRFASMTSMVVLCVLLMVGSVASFFVHRHQTRREAARIQLRSIANSLPEMRIEVGSSDTSLDSITAGKHRLLSAAKTLGIHSDTIQAYDNSDAPSFAVEDYLWGEDRFRLQKLRRETLVLLSHASTRLSRHETDPTAKSSLSQEATEYLEIARRELPRNSPHYPILDSDRVLSLLLRGNYAAAIPILENMRQETPLEFSTWFHLGECYLAVGRLSDAEACFSSCVILWPTASKAFLYRGICRLENRDFEIAESDFNQALILRPNWHPAMFNRALARRGAGDLTNAESDLTTLIDQGKASTRTYLMRSRIRRKLGDKVGADSDLRIGLNSNPSDYRDYVSRGVALLRSNPQAALQDFQQALRLHPASRKALRNAIYVLAEKLGDQQRALEVAEQLILRLGITPDDLMSRAVLYARLGQLDLAREDVNNALSMREDPKLHFQAACAFALHAKQANHKDLAFQHLRKAVSGDPKWLKRLADQDLAALREDDRFAQICKLASAYHAVDTDE